MSTEQSLLSRINEYLDLGGLFNPESMDHQKVRDLMIDTKTLLETRTAAASTFITGPTLTLDTYTGNPVYDARPKPTVVVNENIDDTEDKLLFSWTVGKDTDEYRHLSIYMQKGHPLLYLGWRRKDDNGKAEDWTTQLDMDSLWESLYAMHVEERSAMVELDQYQDAAATTANYPALTQAHCISTNGIATAGHLAYSVLGLASEAGEVAGKVKKLIRDKHGVLTEDDKKDLVKELGDCMWYIADLATVLCVPLSEVATVNIQKLFSRKERGTIQGSGDNR